LAEEVGQTLNILYTILMLLYELLVIEYSYQYLHEIQAREPVVS